jgi:hypothetical protein
MAPPHGRFTLGGMVLRDRILMAALALAAAPLAAAGDDALRTVSASATLTVPHTLQLELDLRARRKSRGAGRYETPDFLDPTPGLTPLRWPRNSDMRARLVTPELKRTPLVGWIAENLYRSERENGWCLEVDPGEGEYVVFYRVNL